MEFRNMNKYGESRDNGVYINPRQNLGNVSATFVHEMYHVADPSYADREFRARLEEIEYLIELSIALNQRIMFDDYIQYGVTTYPPGSLVPRIDHEKLRDYINQTGPGSKSQPRPYDGLPPDLLMPLPPDPLGRSR